MKIKRVIAMAVAALAFAGMGVFTCNVNSVSADQPWRASYKFNNRDLRCYYAYTNNDSENVHFKLGWLPRKYRNRHRVYRLTDPLIDGPMIHRRGYSHEIDYFRVARIHHHKVYYGGIYPNSRDLYRVKDPKKYIKTDLYLLTSSGTIDKSGNIVPKNEKKFARETANSKSYPRQLREIQRQDRKEVIAYNYDKYGTSHHINHTKRHRIRTYKHYHKHTNYRRRIHKSVRK